MNGGWDYTGTMAFVLMAFGASGQHVPAFDRSARWLESLCADLISDGAMGSDGLTNEKVFPTHGDFTGL